MTTPAARLESLATTLDDQSLASPSWRPLAAIIVLAVAVRVALVPLYAHLPGTFNDEDFWKLWMQDIHQYGVINIFRSSDTDYVGYHWVLWALSGTYALVGGPYTHTTPSLHALVKVPSIAFDIVLIAVVYRGTHALYDAVAFDGARPLVTRQRAALIAAAVMAFQPAVLYDGAIWAQTDSAIAAAMLGSVLLAASRRPSLGFGVWALGFLVKPQPIIVLPMLIVLVLRLDGWRGLARGFASAIAVMLVVLGPWIAHGDTMRIVDTYHRLFTADYERLSSSAWNAWWFIDVASHPRPDDAALGALPWVTYRVVGLALSGGAGVLALAVALRLPPLRGGLLASAYVAAAFYILPVSTHERYLYPFLALMLPLVIVEPRRWLSIYAAFSATFFVNLFIVAPPVASWSGRWVESPLSLAVAAANVGLFAVLTLMVVEELRAEPAQASPHGLGGHRDEERLSGARALSERGRRRRPGVQPGASGLKRVHRNIDA